MKHSISGHTSVARYAILFLCLSWMLVTTPAHAQNSEMRIEILEQEVRELRMLVEDLLDELRQEPPYEEEPDSAVFTLPVLASVATSTCPAGCSQPLSRETVGDQIKSVARLNNRAPPNDDTGLLTGEAARNSQYGAMNFIWPPNPAVCISIEGLYGRLERKDGKSQDTARLKATIKHDFVK